MFSVVVELLKGMARADIKDVKSSYVFRKGWWCTTASDGKMHMGKV